MVQFFRLYYHSGIVKTKQNTFLCKWFEPRSISSLSSAIVRVSVVLKRTVGDSG